MDMVEREIELDASAEEVWRALTEPAGAGGVAGRRGRPRPSMPGGTRPSRRRRRGRAGRAGRRGRRTGISVVLPLVGRGRGRSGCQPGRDHRSLPKRRADPPRGAGDAAADPGPGRAAARVGLRWDVRLACLARLVASAAWVLQLVRTERPARRRPRRPRRPHPPRSLYERLAAHGPDTATNLAHGLPVTRQAVVKHLQVLAGAGLVDASAGRARGALRRRAARARRGRRLDGAGRGRLGPSPGPPAPPRRAARRAPRVA